MKIPAPLALASLGTALLVSAGTLAMTSPADASGGKPAVSSSGSCSGSSSWKLKAAPEDGAVQAEFEVDSNIAGQAWAWRLADNGALVAKGTATTGGVSGSFSVRRVSTDQPGADRVTFRARHAGKVCTGSVVLEP